MLRKWDLLVKGKRRKGIYSLVSVALIAVCLAVACRPRGPKNCCIGRSQAGLDDQFYLNLKFYFNGLQG